MREELRQESGGGAMFFMRKLEDLTGKDGELVLCEYSEEHPPLMMQTGMATKIKILCKKVDSFFLWKLVSRILEFRMIFVFFLKSNAISELHFDYGEQELIKNNSSPFLGNLSTDEIMQILDNNLFRAPIYLHDFPETDFLIIRNSEG